VAEDGKRIKGRRLVVSGTVSRGGRAGQQQAAGGGTDGARRLMAGSEIEETETTEADRE
jgi:hypothetical protein